MGRMDGMTTKEEKNVKHTELKGKGWTEGWGWSGQRELSVWCE